MYRESDYERLVAAHGSHKKAAFSLKAKGASFGGSDLDGPRERYEAQQEALRQVGAAIPGHWRRVRVRRAELSRFLFEPDDLVFAIGQDGLVANAAKYLRDQVIIGVAISEALGPLIRFRPREVKRLLASSPKTEARSLVSVKLSTGQSLVALNELFLGVRTHQSARYELRIADSSESQISSGVIVSTGTGSTGWARSIHHARQSPMRLPSPTDATLAYFVREAFPTEKAPRLTEGLLAGETLHCTSRMLDGGVIFGDGIEADALRFPWGVHAEIALAAHRLQLAVA